MSKPKEHLDPSHWYLKATGVPLAKVATRVMLQGDLKEALEFYDTFGW